jgi:hypothetical protein
VPRGQALTSGWYKDMYDSPNVEPINYEAALRDLMARRRRRRVVDALKSLDPRPTSPSQVLLVGVALVGVGWLLPIVHLTILAGLVLLVVGFFSGMIQPRSRRVIWRGRPIDLPPDETWATRLYRILYRSK